MGHLDLFLRRPHTRGKRGSDVVLPVTYGSGPRMITSGHKSRYAKWRHELG